MAERRSPLHDEHVALGAALDYAWAGMTLPRSYGSLEAEHAAVRHAVGLNDASQLQVVEVAGPGCVGRLEELLPRPVEDMAVGWSRFSVVLSRRGRVFDELVLMRLGPERFWLVHGAGGTQRQLGRLGLAFEVLPLGVLAVQGPGSASLLGALVEPPGRWGHRRAALAGREVLVSGSGFTGEQGFELFCAAEDAPAVWSAVTAAGARPYGYDCVELLRLEAGLPLYPADLLVGSLWELGLGWLTRGKVADYVGRAAVEAARGQSAWELARIEGPGTAQRGEELVRDGEVVGTVTSWAARPWQGDGVGLARVRQGLVPGTVGTRRLTDHAEQLAVRPR